MHFIYFMCAGKKAGNKGAWKQHDQFHRTPAPEHNLVRPGRGSAIDLLQRPSNQPSLTGYWIWFLVNLLPLFCSNSWLVMCIVTLTFLVDRLNLACFYYSSQTKIQRWWYTWLFLKISISFFSQSQSTEICPLSKQNWSNYGWFAGCIRAAASSRVNLTQN